MPKKEFQLPEEGEVVLATVTEITPYGAYVTLDEYGGIHGFLHISEVSSGWVKHIDKYIKENQKVVLKVIRVDKIRKEVDLSLRQVTEEEKRNKLILIKKEEKSKSVLKKVALDLQVPDTVLQSYIEKILEEYTSLYSMIDSLLQKGPSVLTKLSLPEDFSQKIYEVAKEKLSPPPVVINEILQITSSAPNGLDVIKQVLNAASKLNDENIMISIKYVGAPNYRLSLSAPNYKIAEQFLKQVNEILQKEARKNKCELSIKRI
ncbi:MAG: translation initiation factor IF-2 subunit alpha, partial [Nitrososphaeria archaeon]